MRKLVLFFLVSCGVYSGVSQDFNQTMAEVMKSMKEYTLEITELMPDASMITGPRTRSVPSMSQIQHLGRSSYFLLNYYLKGNEKISKDEVFKQLPPSIRSNQKRN